MSRRVQHGSGNLIYFVSEGLSNMFTHGFMSFAAIGITVACLLIMGTFSLVAVNANATLARLEQDNEVLAFVEDDLTEAQARALGHQILSVDNVSEIRFITREEALKNYAARFEDSALLEGLEPSVLRHRFAIGLKDLSLMHQTKEAIKEIDGIGRVNAYEEISSGLITIRNIAAVVSIALVSILFLVSVFIIANTIKLTTFDRREEIAIMKMVGATDGFVRWPFVCEGFLLGLLASVIAFFLQWALYTGITKGIAGNDIFSLITIVPFLDIWHIVALVFLAAGMLIGVGGSLSAISQFLKV